MKRFLNKGLLYKGIKNSLPYALIILFFLFIYLTSFQSLFQTLSIRDASMLSGSNFSKYCIQTRGEFDYIMQQQDGELVIIDCLIIFFSAFLIGTDRSGRGYETLSSMNLKKSQIIVTKWLCGAAAITIPFILTCIYTVVRFSSCRYAYVIPDGITRIIHLCIINMLVCIFIYSFIMLIECLSARPVFAAAVGSIFLFLPAALPEMLFAFAQMFLRTNAQYKIYNNFHERVLKIEDNFVLVSYNSNFEGRYLINTLVLTAAIIICFMLMVYAFKRAPLEKNSHPIIFNPLKPIFEIGVTLCCAVAAACAAYGIVQTASFDYPCKIIISMVTLVLSSIIVYFVTNKLIKMNEN